MSKIASNKANYNQLQQIEKIRIEIVNDLQSEIDKDKVALKRLRNRLYQYKHLEKETPRKRQERLATMIENQKKRISQETQNQRKERLAKTIEDQNKIISKETKKQKEIRLMKEEARDKNKG